MKPFQTFSLEILPSTTLSQISTLQSNQIVSGQAVDNTLQLNQQGGGRIDIPLPETSQLCFIQLSYQSFFGFDEGINGTIESNTYSCITYSLSSYGGHSMLGGYESQLQPIFANMLYHEAGYITQDADSGVTGQGTGVPSYVKHRPLNLAKIQINKALEDRYIFNSNLEPPSVIRGYLCSNDASASGSRYKRYRALNADTHKDLGEVSFELDEEEYSTYWRYSVKNTQTNVSYGTDVNNVNNVSTSILITGVEF